MLNSSARLTKRLLIAMLAGVGCGYACHVFAPAPQDAQQIASYFSIVAELFLRLIKMIVAPLVFATLTCGILQVGDTRAISRLGWARWCGSSAPVCCRSPSQTLERLTELGIRRNIVGFVLPLGYSFNLDGSMMYCAFAILFIAQVHGVELTFVQQVSMLLLLLVMSKGLAGVPRASLVVVGAALHLLGLPEQGMLVVPGIDQFLDMGRTATNVVGNSIAAAVVDKWESGNS